MEPLIFRGCMLPPTEPELREYSCECHDLNGQGLPYYVLNVLRLTSLWAQVTTP